MFPSDDAWRAATTNPDDYCLTCGQEWAECCCEPEPCAQCGQSPSDPRYEPYCSWICEDEAEGF